MQIIFLPTICSPPEKLNAGTCWTGTYIPFMPKYEVTRWKFSSFWFWELVPFGRCFENLSNLKGEGVPKPSLIFAPFWCSIPHPYSPRCWLFSSHPTPPHSPVHPIIEPLVLRPSVDGFHYVDESKSPIQKNPTLPCNLIFMWRFSKCTWQHQ